MFYYSSVESLALVTNARNIRSTLQTLTFLEISMTKENFRNAERKLDTPNTFGCMLKLDWCQDSV